MRYIIKAIVYGTLTEMVLVIDNEMNCTKPQEESGITDSSVCCGKTNWALFSSNEYQGLFRENKQPDNIQKIYIYVNILLLLVFNDGLQPLVHSRNSINVCEINDLLKRKSVLGC